jgi:MFS transporter, FSR family, fosmidomycin resistance protein
VSLRRTAADERPAAGSGAAAFDRGTVATLSAAHLVHDSYPAFLGVMLPLLIPKLDMSLAVAGLLATGMRWTTSVQPLLGYWADRTDTRYWVIITPTTTALFMSLAGVAPSQAALFVLLLLTGLSHAAFHPPAGAMATRASGTRWGTGMAWFMTGGDLGRALGPLYIAAVLMAVDVEGSWIAFLPSLLASFVLYRRLHRQDSVHLKSTSPPRIRDALRAGSRPFFLLSTAMITRSALTVGFVLFYPTFGTTGGATLLRVGLALTVFELSAAGGAFLGGILSDRLGRKPTMLVGLLIGIPPMIGAVLLGPSGLGIAAMAVGGFAVRSSSSVELVAMQQLLPHNRSSAVGIAYFMKAGGAIISMVGVGALGDWLGIGNALLVAIGVGLLALPGILLLPSGAVEAPAALPEA